MFAALWASKPVRWALLIGGALLLVLGAIFRMESLKVTAEKAKAKARRQDATIQTQERMRDAHSNAPRGRDAVSRRLRDGRF